MPLAIVEKAVLTIPKDRKLGPQGNRDANQDCPIAFRSMGLIGALDIAGSEVGTGKEGWLRLWRLIKKYRGDIRKALKAAILIGKNDPQKRINGVLSLGHLSRTGTINVFDMGDCRFYVLGRDGTQRYSKPDDTFFESLKAFLPSEIQIATMTRNVLARTLKQSDIDGRLLEAIAQHFLSSTTKQLFTERAIEKILTRIKCQQLIPQCVSEIQSKRSPIRFSQTLITQIVLTSRQIVTQGLFKADDSALDPTTVVAQEGDIMLAITDGVHETVELPALFELFLQKRPLRDIMNDVPKLPQVQDGPHGKTREGDDFTLAAGRIARVKN